MKWIKREQFLKNIFTLRNLFLTKKIRFKKYYFMVLKKFKNFYFNLENKIDEFFHWNFKTKIFSNNLIIKIKK